MGPGEGKGQIVLIKRGFYKAVQVNLKCKLNVVLWQLAKATS